MTQRCVPFHWLAYFSYFVQWLDSIMVTYNLLRGKFMFMMANHWIVMSILTYEHLVQIFLFYQDHMNFELESCNK